MTTDKPQRLLTFSSGGWVLLLGGVFALGVFIWALAGAYVRIDRPLIGDLRNVDSYGFDLQQCRVRRELIAPGIRKDALKAMVDPAVIAGYVHKGRDLGSDKR